MGDHYFSDNPASPHQIKTVEVRLEGRVLSLKTDSGVFSRDHVDSGTAVLLRALPDDFDGRALDLGCGWGAAGISMALRWPRAEVILTDVNARATDLAAQNAMQSGVSVQVCTGDGLSAVGGLFGLIAINPPIRAGKAVVYRLFGEAADRLLPGGSLYVVMRKQQGAPSAKAFLQTIFAQVDTVARSGGFHVIHCIRQG